MPALAFAVGLVFALGLGLSGMTRPDVVQGFLDVTGAWDPRLLLVMASAVTVYHLAYRRARRDVARGCAPALAPRYSLPTRRDVDARLIGGAAVFGAGWGLAGYCPGPALAGLATGADAAIGFVAAMALGMLGHRLWTTLRAPATAAAPAAPPISPRPARLESLTSL
jgi:hypothetical protein